MGSSESFIELLKDPTSILNGNHDEVLGAAGPAVIEYLLKQPCNENAASIFKYLYNKMPEKFPYHNDYLRLAERYRPNEWLETIIQVYGTDVRDVRERTSYEHLLQGLINLNWIKGVEYLLQKDPSLVNIAIIIKDYDNTQNVYPLLVWIMKDKIKVPSIVEIILKHNVNLSLKDREGNNIYHYIAKNYQLSETSPASIAIFQFALKNATPPLVLAVNDAGLTPALLAERFGEQELVEIFTAIEGDAAKPEAFAELIDYNPERDIPGNLFSQEVPLSHRKVRLYHSMNAKIPTLSSDTYFCSLAGKALSRENAGKNAPNARLFFNFECLYEYLVEYANHRELPAIVNAVVIRVGGTHAINVYCRIDDKKNISAIIIDGLFVDTIGAEAEQMGIKLKAAGINFKSVVLKDKIQFTYSGCRVISAYLASKFSNLTPDAAKDLIDMLFKKSVEGSVGLKDFPLSLGLLSICASMSVIERVKKELPEEALNEPINRKAQPETFNEVLTRGMFLQYHDYVSFDQNKMQNQTLQRKVNHQKEYAEEFLECLEKEPDRAIEAVATLLGIKEMCKDWKAVTTAVIGGSKMKDWGELQKFRFSEYPPSRSKLGAGPEPEPERPK